MFASKAQALLPSETHSDPGPPGHCVHDVEPEGCLTQQETDSSSRHLRIDFEKYAITVVSRSSPTFLPGAAAGLQQVPTTSRVYQSP